MFCKAANCLCINLGAEFGFSPSFEVEQMGGLRSYYLHIIDILHFVYLLYTASYEPTEQYFTVLAAKDATFCFNNYVSYDQG